MRPLLPGLAGCLVLVTSRNQLTGLLATECARLLALDVLSAAESRKLLTHRLGAARAAAEPEAVDDIAASCAGLPLALAIASARAEFPLGVLAAELRDSGRGLDALDCQDDATGVRAMLSWSYHRLSTDAACLFRLLGLHPGPHVSAAAAASLAGAPVKAVRRQLAELVGDAALRAARRSGSLIGQAHAHRGLAGAATSLGRHEEARWHLDQALQLFGDSGSSADQAHIHRNMALVLEKQGHYADALGHACQSSELYGTGGDLIGEARALPNIGRLRSLQGDPDGALDCCNRALALLSDCDDGRGEANAWDNLGWIHHRLGDYQRAAICYQRAIDLLGQYGDRSSQATALAKLGDAYHAVADTDAARLAWRQALSMMDSKLGNPFAEELRAKLRLAGAVAPTGLTEP